MRVSVAADERTGVADAVVEELRRRGYEPVVHGALSDAERDDWAWASEAAARDVVDGRADQGIVCCWTGTGASIAANKVPGVRAALCADAETARGARKWNDANVLALSLRTTSPALLEEILDAWFSSEPSSDADDVANIRHVDEIVSARFTVTFVMRSRPTRCRRRPSRPGSRCTCRAGASSSRAWSSSRRRVRRVWLGPSRGP